MKYFIFIILCWTMNIAWALEQFPPNCRPIMITGDVAVIKAKKLPMLALIHNISEMDIWVTHPVTDPGASAGWMSRIQGDHWSALVLQKQPFELNCVESKPGHEQIISCQDVLAICGWKHVKMPMQDADGAYWAGEDMPLEQLIAYIGRRGFVPKT